MNGIFKKQDTIFLKKFIGNNQNRKRQYARSGLINILSPGRVNIIGEHTDYNSGLAIPLAINKYKFFTGLRNGTGNVEIYDNTYKEYHSFSLDNILYDENNKWTNYIKGVVKEYVDNNYNISGFSMIVDSNLLSGAGVSSSAAILIGTARIIEEIFNLEVEKMDTMNYCHDAENNFVGIDNGILDHFSVLFGKKDHAIYLDFDSLNWEYVPFDLKENLILIIDSKEERYLPGTD